MPLDESHFASGPVDTTGSEGYLMTTPANLDFPFSPGDTGDTGNQESFKQGHRQQ